MSPIIIKIQTHIFKKWFTVTYFIMTKQFNNGSNGLTKYLTRLLGSYWLTYLNLATYDNDKTNLQTKIIKSCTVMSTMWDSLFSFCFFHVYACFLRVLCIDRVCVSWSGLLTKTMFLQFMLSFLCFISFSKKAMKMKMA